jgi:hypothetical protein
MSAGDSLTAVVLQVLPRLATPPHLTSPPKSNSFFFQARGVSKDTFAKIAVALFPFEIAFAFLVGRITDQQRPLKQWTRALVGRLVMSLLGSLVVFLCPSDAKEHGLPIWYFTIMAGAAVCNSLAGAVTFTSMSAFFTRIGDPAIGGTCVHRARCRARGVFAYCVGRYITLLNTVSNIGGLVPQTGVMFVAEWVQTMVGQEAGYYSCVCGSVFIGFALMPVMVKLVRSVETLPLSEWRVRQVDAGDCEMQTDGYSRVGGEDAAITTHMD